MSKHTPGPWVAKESPESEHSDWIVSGPRLRVGISTDRSAADARLIAAAPTMAAEMQRYLPVLERAEADPALWERLTQGLGIATANGYRAALAKANGEGNR